MLYKRPDHIFNPKNLNQLSNSLLETFGQHKKNRRRSKWSLTDSSSYTRADIVNEKACGK